VLGPGELSAPPRTSETVSHQCPPASILTAAHGASVKRERGGKDPPQKLPAGGREKGGAGLAAQRDATMTRGFAKIRLTAERSPAAWMTQGTIAPRHPASAEAGVRAAGAVPRAVRCCRRQGGEEQQRKDTRASLGNDESHASSTPPSFLQCDMRTIRGEGELQPHISGRKEGAASQGDNCSAH
jgi:hypothetical protein